MKKSIPHPYNTPSAKKKLIKNQTNWKNQKKVIRRWDRLHNAKVDILVWF